MNKKFIIGGLVVAVLIGLVVWITSTPASPTETSPETSNVPRENRDLGSLTGPDISSLYLAVNGVRREYRSKVFDTDTFGVTGTTTPCIFDSPAATSTLVSASFTITSATGTATQLTMGTSTQALRFATSSPIGSMAIPANRLPSYALVGTTSAAVISNGSQDGLYPPNSVLVFSTQGALNAGNPAAFYGPVWAGRCAATFEVI